MPIEVPAPTVAPVTLPTGDKVTGTTMAGSTQSTYVVQQGTHPASGQFATYQDSNGDHYVIPSEAEPYLGRQLSPSLFDVTALRKAGVSTGTKIPVSLGFAAGTTPAAPAGVTLTSVSGQSAQGYLTSASGTALAAALRTAIGADVRAGRRPGSSALFGGLTSLSPAGSGGVTPGVTGAAGTAPQAVSPLYKLYDLQITALDLSGLPDDNGMILLVDTDSVHKEDTLVQTGGGVARVAVPAGHYALVSYFTDFDAQGDAPTTRMVALDDFTVAASTAGTDVTVDERTATNPITVSVPSPATQDLIGTTWVRTDATGVESSFEETAVGASGFYTNSQPQAKTGKVILIQIWGGAGTGPGTPYRYDLAFSEDKVPANESFTVKKSQLATVNQNFYHDPAFPQSGEFISGAISPAVSDSFASADSSPSAGPLTEYLSSSFGDDWFQVYISPENTFYFTDDEDYAAGKTYAVTWAQGPLAPNVGNFGGVKQQSLLCEGCASGSDLSAQFNEVGDSNPEHDAFSQENTDYTAYVNGAQVFTGTAVGGTEILGLPSGPSVIRQVLDTDASDTGDTQSVTTHTDLTFDYTPGQTGPTAPSSVACDPESEIASPCQILPLLHVGYDLLDDALNTGVPGVQTLELTVDHLSYFGVGSAAAITSATVSVSFDNGQSWQPTTVLGSAGSYTAAWITPASAVGTSPDLKVTATDAIGGSISQTVDEAYTVAAPATSN